MRQSVLLLMSLSGSIVFLLYLILRPFTQKYFSAKWRYRILKMALLFYVFPFSYFKYKLLNLFLHFSPMLQLKFKEQIKDKFDFLYLKIYDGSQVFLSKYLKIIILFVGVWGIISIVMTILQLYDYYKPRISLKKFGYIPASKSQISLLHETEKVLKLNREIKLVSSELSDTPFTMGIFFPMIVIPNHTEMRLENKEWNYIIKHELIHIKNFDPVIKFVCLLAVALNWYNPLCYYLFREICIISEISCDSQVIKEGEENQRIEYCNLILTMAEEHNINNGHFSVGLVSYKEGKSRKIIEKRILEMKIKRKKKTIVAGIVGVLICIIGGSVSFAYSPIPSIASEVVLEYTDQDQFRFVSEEKDYIPFDNFFTDEQGIIYETINAKEKPECPQCQFAQGNFTQHLKNSNGGCKIYYYIAERCNTCDFIHIIVIDNIAIYKICQH